MSGCEHVMEHEHEHDMNMSMHVVCGDVRFRCMYGLTPCGERIDRAESIDRRDRLEMGGA